MDILSLYIGLGYPVLQLSALKDISALQPYLQGHLSVLALLGERTLFRIVPVYAEGKKGIILQSACSSFARQR